MPQSGTSWLGMLVAQPQPRVLLQDENGSGGLAQRLIDALRREHTVLAQLMSPLSRVHEHASALRAGMCLPVGSPEFVRACMRAAGIDEPNWNCYPRELASHLAGHPRKVSAAAALQWTRPAFIRPARGSAFRAFVLREELQAMDRWEKTQLLRLLRLPGTAAVWVSRVLPIVAEWRYYVLNGEVVGYAPSGPVSRDKSPAIGEVSSMIAAAPSEGAFALDVGVLRDGSTSLLRVRDAWAVEWYPFAPEAPDPLAFLHFLWARWSEMLLTPRRVAANSSVL